MDAKYRSAAEKEEAARVANLPAWRGSLRKKPSEKRLQAYAYALRENEYVGIVLFEIHVDSEMRRESRLVPYLAKAMEYVKGKDLLRVMELARSIPDPVYLEPILSHALDKDYIDVLPATIHNGHHERIRCRVAFVHMALLLYELSDGKIGLKLSHEKGEFLTTKERKKLIRQWRTTWAQMNGRPPPPSIPDEVEISYDTKILWGEEQEGCRVGISGAQHRTIRAQDPLCLVVTLINVSDFPIELNITSAENDYWIRVQDELGEDAPLSGYGKRLAENAGESLRRIRRSLDRGEMLSEELPINRLFVMTRVGKYSIQVARKVDKREGDGFVTVASPVVTVTVTDQAEIDSSR